MIPLSSLDKVGVEVDLPTSWRGLTDAQLHYVAELASSNNFSNDEIKALLITRTARLSKSTIKQLSGYSYVEAMNVLEWMDTPPTEPICFDRLDGHQAVRLNLYGVPFSHYLEIENYYQGYLQTQNRLALQAICTILYPGFVRNTLTAAEQYAVLLWLVGLKALYVHMFPYLFSSSNTEGGEPVDPREVMNAEMRALTGGDITKTKAVLEADTLTALTELDAKAREAEFVRRSMKE